MKVRLTRILALVLLLLAPLGLSTVLPVHAAGDFTLANKVVVNGVVTANLGIADGGILGCLSSPPTPPACTTQIAAANVVNGTANSIAFTYTVNATGPTLPVVTLTPATVTLPTTSPRTTNTDNTTMKIVVDQNVPHGAYNVTVAATSGSFTHYL